MNTIITRLIAIGYTQDQAAKLYCLYNRQNRAAELEEHIATKELLAPREVIYEHECLSY